MIRECSKLQKRVVPAQVSHHFIHVVSNKHSYSCCQNVFGMTHSFLLLFLLLICVYFIIGIAAEPTPTPTPCSHEDTNAAVCGLLTLSPNLCDNDAVSTMCGKTCKC